MSDVGLRILQQVNDAQNRRVEEGYESPTARVARARMETEDAERRIQGLKDYTSRPEYDFGSDDTSSNGLVEFGKGFWRTGEDTVKSVKKIWNGADLTGNVNRLGLSDEQKIAVDLSNSRNKNQEQIEQYQQAALVAGMKGQESTRAANLAEVERLKSFSALYNPVGKEAEVLNARSNPQEIARIEALIADPNSAYYKMDSGSRKRVQKKLKDLKSVSLDEVVTNNISRIKDNKAMDAGRDVFAADINKQATRDRQIAEGEVDGSFDSILNRVKAYGENPSAIANELGQLPYYLTPYVGQAKVATDIMDSNFNMAQNTLDDRAGLLLTEQDDRRILKSTALQAVLMAGGQANLVGSALKGKSLGSLAGDLVSKPLGKASEKISNSLANLPKAQKAFQNTAKASGAVGSAASKIAVDTGFEFAQEGAQDAVEQIGSDREVNWNQVLDSAVSGGIIGGAATAGGTGFSGAKALINTGTNAAKKAVNKSTAPMDDANLLDSNSTDYSPVAVVEDASKALSTGNASREVIKESKSRIKNATKTVNKEIQDLERLVSLKTKQEKLIADGDIEGATANLKVINDLDNNMSLKVANERLVTVKEAKIAMEAELVRSNNKVSKATDNANTVSQATEVTKLVAELETNKTAIDDLDTQISDTTKSTGEIAALKNQKLKLENQAMATVSKINKLNPEAIKGKLDNISSNTEVNNKTIKEKINSLC